MGYGGFIKFDHDFIGREALEKMKDKPHRHKVTFEWNTDDVAKIFRSFFDPEVENYKYIDLPLSNYGSASFDTIKKGNKTVGLSMFSGTTWNTRRMLSLGVVDPEIKQGDVLTLVWGEENGGTKKTTVERHKQTEIRVKVAPVPYASEVRESYGGGWRLKQTA